VQAIYEENVKTGAHTNASSSIVRLQITLQVVQTALPQLFAAAAFKIVFVSRRVYYRPKPTVT